MSEESLPLPASPAVGVAGLGLMGAPMARRLLAAGHRVQVWNRSVAKTRPLVTAGAGAAATPAALAADCDVLVICLTDQHAVEQVVFGADGLVKSMRSGTVLVDHSSIAPDAARAMGQRLAAEAGGIWIDAPVSGGVAGVENASLAIMAGGPAQAIEQVAPIVRSYAARITRVGDTGAGQIAKLCNQVIVATTIGAISEAVALAARTGIDAAALPEALAGGWADSVLLQTFVPRMADGYEQMVGAADTMHKDVRNVLDFAAAHGIDLRIVQAVEAVYAQAAAQGLGAQDISEIVRVAWPDRPDRS